MLVPDSIPRTEPHIRVGIILPEDNYTSVTLQTPKEYNYQLDFDGRTLLLEAEQTIFIKLHERKIHILLNDQQLSSDGLLRIFPVIEKVQPAPQHGLKVKNVISGRGFHWKKYIDVTLPGTIVVERYETQLMLINELPVEHYLMCVATSEMGAASPAALIEAQTIVARSWLLATVEQKHKALGIDVCNDDCCQRYQGSTFLTQHSISGALNTYGQVLLYKEKICDARYSKSCGGVMESFDTIWGGASLPYLQVKADALQSIEEWRQPLSDEQNFRQWIEALPHTFCSPHIIPERELKRYLGSVDEEGNYFRWQVTLSQKELLHTLQQHHGIEAQKVLALKALSRGGSGRINRLDVHFVDQNGKDKILQLTSEYAIRQSLHSNFLYSSAFIIEPHGEDFILRGAGWGHGVGLCQIGALGMALKGYATKEILDHYYPGSRLQKIY